MPGLVPGIHVLETQTNKDVDGRDKPGHDVHPHAACSAARSTIPMMSVMMRFSSKSLGV
jgi:hypothetical protein